MLFTSQVVGGSIFNIRVNCETKYFRVIQSFKPRGLTMKEAVQPTASVPVALPENSSSAAVNVPPSYDHTAAKVDGAGRGRSFRQTVYRRWLQCLCMKHRDDEKDMFFSSPSKFDSIPLQSKERDRNNEKDTSSSKFDIPLDLEVEILTRLPAKSLMKFQCVSKMWSSIIRSQRFVDSYYPVSAKRSRFIIAFSNGCAVAKDEDKRLFIFSSSHEGREFSSLATNLDLTIPSVVLSSSSICASVHGFIGCTSGRRLNVFNPSTWKAMSLPCIGPGTSLGYDPVDDQFKALTLLSHPHQEPDYLVHEVVILGGREYSWRCNEVFSPLYYPLTKPVCINGFMYFGAWTPTRDKNPVIVCFDVRYETISFIKAPVAVVCWEGESILIEYKGKLASIARHPYHQFTSFDLWILEDVKKHDWSKQTFELPFSLGLGTKMTSPGTNKAGEIIFAPTSLSRDVQPFYIFYYNVDRKDIRRVRLLGIADNEEFRRRYRISGECYVCISPQHVENIASL